MSVFKNNSKCIVYMLLGGDPGKIINQSHILNSDNPVSYEQTAEDKELTEFVSVVLADTEYVFEILGVGCEGYHVDKFNKFNNLITFEPGTYLWRKQRLYLFQYI